MFGDFHFCCPSLTAAGLGDDESLNPEESAYSEARTSFLADDISAIKLESFMSRFREGSFGWFCPQWWFNPAVRVICLRKD